MTRRSTGSSGSQGHNFSQTASAEIPRSTFNRSSTLKTSFNGSDLNPIFNDEMLPGDTVNLKQRSFVRLSTPLLPAMDEITIETQYFFVPLRLIWDDYPAFMGEQLSPDDSIDFTVPQMVTTSTSSTSDSLSHKLGIPLQGGPHTHSCLFHRAYTKIWNDWYRDANLQDLLVLDTDAGPDLEADHSIQKRGKRKDYFTSCLPWPQRGDPINLIFDGILPVVITPDTDTGIPTFDYGNKTNSALEGNAGTSAVHTDAGVGGTTPHLSWNDPQLVGSADLSAASVNTINGLRSAFAVQRLLERDARGGARLTEILYAHFKVRSPDMRLQRAEYLGGNTINLNITAVPLSSQAASGVVGDLGGYGVGHGNASNIVYSATEHGIIMGICSARAPLAYQQGLHRKFTRFSRYDFFFPAFSHIGEQPVLNGEIYNTGTGDRTAGTGDFGVFGYNEAWSSYRYRPNEITGKMNSEASTSLDPWHLALDFDSLPTLDDSFIVDDTPFGRIVVNSANQNFIADFAFDLKHTRPLPTFSTPGLIDHF